MKSNSKKAVIVISAIVAVVLIMVIGYFIGNAMVNKKDTNTSSDQNIVLGDYKGIKVDQRVTEIDEISDAMVEEEMLYLLDEYSEYKEVTDRGVKKGDFVNLDYEGELDGEKLEELKFEDLDIVLGENETFQSLEEAVIGMKTGEEKKVDVIFTDQDVIEEEYIGKTASFSVTINGIQEISVEPELTDEFIKNHTDYQSLDDMKKIVRQDLLQYEIESSEEQLITDIMNQIMDNSKLESYSQEKYDMVYEEIRTELEQGAAMFGFSLEEYLEFIGEGDSIPEQWVKDRILEEGVMELIISKENIKVSDKEYKQMLEEYLDQIGEETVEAAEETYEKEELVNFFKSLKLQKFLIDNADITKLSAKEYDEKYNDDNLDVEELDADDFDEDDVDADDFNEEELGDSEPEDELGNLGDEEEPLLNENLLEENIED